MACEIALLPSVCASRSAMHPPARPRAMHPPARPRAVASASHDRVSILIPTRYRLDLLDLCLGSLARNTSHANKQVIIIDNGADEKALGELLDRHPFGQDLRRIRRVEPFNFSRLINAGAAAANGRHLLLLNDDVEAVAPDWLDRMLEHLQDPSVGVVGARLLYPDGALQHGGVTLGLNGLCGHLWRGLSPQEAQLWPAIHLPGERSAVTAACMLVRADLFQQLGGLDESFPVTLGDIDFCLRARAAGHRVLYAGETALVHHESRSRGEDATPAQLQRLRRETAEFLDRWAELLFRGDPWASPALDLSVEGGMGRPSP